MQTDARRVTALAALTILVAVGAGHLGSAAVLAVALVAVTCPWLSEALMGRPRRQRR